MIRSGDRVRVIAGEYEGAEGHVDGLTWRTAAGQERCRVRVQIGKAGSVPIYAYESELRAIGPHIAALRDVVTNTAPTRETGRP